MADYYPVLTRAVSGLATNNAQARRELYEHARTVFIAQLRRQDSQLSALETIRESIAFEMAILRVEAESLSMPERRPETFADYVPLPDANDIADFASLLREPVEVGPAPAQAKKSAPIRSSLWKEVAPAPSLLSPSPLTNNKRIASGGKTGT
jgi:hypothetical protein